MDSTIYSLHRFLRFLNIQYRNLSQTTILDDFIARNTQFNHMYEESEKSARCQLSLSGYHFELTHHSRIFMFQQMTVIHIDSGKILEAHNNADYVTRP